MVGGDDGSTHILPFEFKGKIGQFIISDRDDKGVYCSVIGIKSIIDC